MKPAAWDADAIATTEDSIVELIKSNHNEPNDDADAEQAQQTRMPMLSNAIKGSVRKAILRKGSLRKGSPPKGSASCVQL